jgi:hypothetical protein
MTDNICPACGTRRDHLTDGAGDPPCEACASSAALPLGHEYVCSPQDCCGSEVCHVVIGSYYCLQPRSAHKAQSR